MCQAFLLVTKEYIPDTYILYLHLTAFNNRGSCMEVDLALRECCDAAHVSDFSELARPFKLGVGNGIQNEMQLGTATDLLFS